MQREKDAEIKAKARVVLEYYESEFRRVFGEIPVLTGEDHRVARMLVQRYPLEKIREFVLLYLKLEGFVKQQGYAFRFLEQQVNVLIVNKALPQTTMGPSLAGVPNPEETKKVLSMSRPKEIAPRSIARKAVEAVMNGTFRLDEDF